MNTEHRVYDARLASYNNGILYGRWVDYAVAVDGLHSDAEREAFAFWYDDFADPDHDARELEENFRDAYMCTFENEVDWAEQYIDDTGLLAEVPDTLRYYFDYGKYARDAFFELAGHRGDHGFHVFSNH